MLRWSILALFGLAVSSPALAQQQAPPARVGTISYVSGNIAFHTSGETAGVNYPVATGGSFWTDPQGRAELQIGPSTIDMAGGTEIDVTNLDEQVAQFAVPQGELYLHLRQLETGQTFEIDLPQGAVWLLQPGVYDIDAGAADQPARVAVFNGSTRFVGGGSDIGIDAGNAALLSGSNPVTAQVEHVSPDAFVAWARARDYGQAQAAAATPYISPQMTGYADLDQYGSWQPNPQYGEIWYPNQIPADWAPYGDGRWIWVEPWGWTWIDAQPWGFAPFHYGRWAYMDNRWGWVPGQYVPQPVYAPALVAFIGAAAGGFFAGGAGPAIAWFPLAPGEPYWPSYTRNQNYIRSVNAANVRDISTVIARAHGVPPPAANANFANRRFATVVPQRVFANAEGVAPHAMHVTSAALAKAPVALHPPALRPTTRPTALAARGPSTTRPVPRGSGAPPPGHPGPVVAGRPGPGRPPGTPEQGPALGHPRAPASTAALRPHSGAANANERGPHVSPARTAATGAPGRGPGSLEHAVAHPPGAPRTAALPPHPSARVVAPAHPPAASIRREPPPAVHAQAFRPPPPVRPHPTAPAARPPAVMVHRPIARPSGVPHPPAGHPAPVARGGHPAPHPGGHPGERRE
jgi:hypothetical protein